MSTHNTSTHNPESGKRGRTRRALLDSAARVFAERGIQASSIREITTAAGMSNGTFYNYFPDKDALVRAVVVELAARTAGTMDDEPASAGDPARRVARNSMRAIEVAIEDPQWATVLVEAMRTAPEMREQGLQFLRRDLEQTAAAAGFALGNTPLLVEQCVALLTLGMQLQIEGGHDPQVTDQTCAALLQLAGVPAARARATVNRARKELTRGDAT